MDELLARVRAGLRRNDSRPRDVAVITTASFTADLPPAPRHRADGTPST